MIWNKYTIVTTEEAEDAVAEMLGALGIDSIEIEDRTVPAPEEQGGLFGDVVPDMGPDDGSARITFYTEEGEDGEELLAKVREGLEGLREWLRIGSGTIEKDSTKSEDWENTWKQYFHTFFVDDIRIVPSWEETDEEAGQEPEGAAEGAMTLRIDPGTAFGTGSHESTQLAIRGLRRYLTEGMKVLDVGAGSGILGIVAIKSGASFVYATDIDPVAFPAMEENLAKNGIDPERHITRLANLITDPAAEREALSAAPGGYDLVTANIIAEILAELTPHIPALLRKGGIYVTSGILAEKEALVRKAVEEAGLTYLETRYQGEWCSVVARK
ncbi:MAG: 50S ribosomal protein L11 methyltransferase [Lachnospiraceae bacterium]|nr:50S ribosomal protein L11 methyltransferase [Lachnospiraceae bacterium]